MLLTLSNPKIIKGQPKGYLTAILHLAPHNLSGYNVCPMASAGCSEACLNLSGHGGMIPLGQETNRIQEARKARTVLFFEHRDQFMLDLLHDVRTVIKYADRQGLIPVFRFNGTSDIRWENMPIDGSRNIMEKFPSITFYDYTKLPNRKNLPANYSLTFSRSETNEMFIPMAISNGMNVAVVFRKGPAKIKVVKTYEQKLAEKIKRDAQKKNRKHTGRHRAKDYSWLPTSYMGYPVINGDETDLRFLDQKPCIVGLTAKGKAKYDTSGFCVDVLSEKK